LNCWYGDKIQIGKKLLYAEINTANNYNAHLFISGRHSISAMKMYRNRKSASDPNNNNLIVVATNESGAGRVYKNKKTPVRGVFGFNNLH
jgi:hypothetical protein